MARNEKLTAVIRGRGVQAVARRNKGLILTFDDGSVMTIKLSVPVEAIATPGIIRAVRQSGTSMSFDFEGGSTLHMTTAEATSCVLLRDRSGLLEYAD
jgi:hypothetical protein